MDLLREYYGVAYEYTKDLYFMSTDKFFGILAMFLIAMMLCTYFTVAASNSIYASYMGKREMRKRRQLKEHVREIVEDLLSEGLTEAVANKRISLDEAREIYAKVAHLGFWGLHPRKFTPRKTGLDLTLLKEEIKAKRNSLQVRAQEPDGMATQLVALMVMKV